MKTSLLSITTVLVFNFSLIAQQSNNFGFKWIQHHGDRVNFAPEAVWDVQTDRWGNVYVGGQVNDLFVRDSNGNNVKSLLFPLFDSLHNNGGVDIWLAKYSPNGKLLWHRYAGSGGDDLYGGMVADKDGNCYVTGRIIASQSIRPIKNFGNRVIPFDSLGTFVAKVDSGGNLLWHKSFGGDTLLSGSVPVYIPYEADPISLSLINNEISCYFRGGSFGGVGSFGFQKLFKRDSIELGLHEARFDLNGNYLGVKSFPFPRIDRLPQIREITAAANSRIVTGILNRDTLLVGNDTILKQAGNFDNSVSIGFDSSLNHLWTFNSNNFFDQFIESAQMGDTLVVSGHFDMFTSGSVTFDTIQFSGNPNTFQSGAVFLFSASSGNLIGFYPSLQRGSNSRVDAFAAGINKKYFGVGGCFTREMTYSGTSNFMQAINRIPFQTNDDLFFTVFDRNGNFVTEDLIFTSGRGRTGKTTAMHFDDSTLYIGGGIDDSVYIAGVDTFITEGRMDAFVAAYRLDILTSLEEIPNGFVKAKNGILAYPNPTSGPLSLMGKAVNNEGLLYNISGQLVRTFKLDVNAFQQSIDASNLPNGIYFLIIVGKEKRQELKIVKTD